jgi:hypothetical protein
MENNKLLYEVYERAVRTQDPSGFDNNNNNNNATTTTTEGCHQLISLNSNTLVLFDGNSQDILFFSSMDDFSKPTRTICSVDEVEGSKGAGRYARVYGGKDALVAVTESGLFSIIDAQGNQLKSSTSLRIPPGKEVAFMIPQVLSGEVLLVTRDASIEVHSLLLATAKNTNKKKKVVKASKFHNSVVRAAYCESNNSLCLVGDDHTAAAAALESISVWKFEDEELRSLHAKPFAHFGLGQNKFQRYVLSAFNVVQKSLRMTQQSASKGNFDRDWTVTLSPLGERIAVKTPRGVHLFQIAEDDATATIKPMDTAGLVGSLGCESVDECQECLWWSEDRLLCNVNNSKLLVLQTRDRDVLFEHSFAAAASKANAFAAIHMSPLSPSKGMVLKASASEEEAKWQLMCVAHRSPEEMLHSYLAKCKFDEAMQIAKIFQLDRGMIHKRQWLQSEPTVGNIEGILFMIQDKLWVTEQCICSVSEDLQAQRYLLNYGVERASAIILSASNDEAAKTEATKKKVRLLRYIDCLETSLALYNQTYFVEVYRELRNYNLASMACLFAQTANFDSLQILIQHHPCFVLPSILQVISCFPESMDVNLYKSVFDYIHVRDISAKRESDPSCETEEELRKAGLMEALEKGEANNNILCKVTDNVCARAESCQSPSMETVRAWIPVRLLEIVNSGHFLNARTFVEIITSLSEPIITPDISKSFASVLAFTDAVGMGLVRWDMDACHFLDASHFEKLQILLALSTNETIERDVLQTVLPFLSSQCTDDHSDVEELLLTLVEEECKKRPVWAVTFLSQVCSSIAEDLTLDKVRFAKKAIDLLKMKPNMGDWDVLSKSLSGLLTSLVREKDESIVADIKTLCDRIQCARLLAKYGLKVDIALLEEYSKDSSNERTLLRKLLSKAAQQRKQTDEMWDHLWNDACIVCDLIFKSYSYEPILAEFCRVLLQAGQFLLAERFLDGKDGIQLSHSIAEKIVLATGKELFYGAKAFSSPEVAKAKQCFLSVQDSKLIRMELDFISSLENVHQFGLVLRPCDIKSISEKADIFDMILKHDPSSYANVTGLIQFANSLHLDSKQEHLKIKLKLARVGFELEDIGFALDLVNLFMEEKFVPAADFVIHTIKNVDLATLEDDFLADMVSFALCYCPEREITFLVGELKSCIKSYGQTVSTDSILREHDFWLNKACSAVSSLVKVEDIESVVEYVESIVVTVDNYVQVERIFSTLLAAFAVKAGIQAADSPTNAFSFMSPKETRKLLEGLIGGEAQGSNVANELMQWFELLKKAGILLQYSNKLKVGSFVMGSNTDRESLVLQVIDDLTQGSASKVPEALPVIFSTVEDCGVELGKLLQEVVAKTFGYGKCDSHVTLVICGLLGTLKLSEGSLAGIADTCVGDLYEGMEGTDTFNLVYLVRILKTIYSLLTDPQLTGQLAGYRSADLDILEDILALIVWTEEAIAFKSHVDFKCLLESKESCVSEMRKCITFNNVNGFASICDLLSQISRWRDSSASISTSNVYLIQLECDLDRSDLAPENLINVVSKSLKRLHVEDLQHLVQILIPSHGSGDEEELSQRKLHVADHIRLSTFEVALEVATEMGKEGLVSLLKSTIVNEKALQSMDETLNLRPTHRNLLDQAKCTEDLYSALGFLAEEGVDLCVLIFAASAYGILDEKYASLRLALVEKTRRLLDSVDWESEQGVLPLIRIIQSLQASESPCLSQLEGLSGGLLPFVDVVRTSVWNEIQSHIKEKGYGDSTSAQPVVLFLSEKFAMWKDWTQPADEGFEHIVLLCQSNDILDQSWEVFGHRNGNGKPQTSKDDFTSMENMKGCFDRLLAIAEEQSGHAKVLHQLLICWEENWKPQEEIAELEECYLRLLVKCLEQKSEYALSVLFHMEKGNHPTVRDEEKCESFFHSRLEQVVAGEAGVDSFCSCVFFKCALLVPCGGVHSRVFRALESAADAIGLDDDLIGLLLYRGLLSSVSQSEAFMETCTRVLARVLVGTGEREATRQVVVPILVAELCLLQEFERACQLASQYLRIHPKLLTRDMTILVLQRYLRANTRTAREGEREGMNRSNQYSHGAEDCANYQVENLTYTIASSVQELSQKALKELETAC